MNAHHDKLEAAAALVADKRKAISDIRAAIASQEEIVAENERHRQAQTLQAAMGDVTAKEALAKILHEDLAAERTLADLRKALPQIERELANAELAQKAAADEFRRAEVVRLARERVAAAAEIDQAFAQFSRAYATFVSLGSELLDLASQEPGANALFLAETISGEARLVAALPAAPFLQLKERYPFMTISTSKSLAASEAQYWKLPALDEAKAA
jgi:hypothetical protein